MKKALKLSLYFASLFAMFSTFNACKPEPEPEPVPEPEIPASITVTTSSVSNITETSAKCGGDVTATGYTVGECGLCWNTTGNPTIYDDRTTDQIGTGYFVSTMSGLKKNTKYYVKAYAITNMGTLYGEEKSFTTEGVSNPTGYINGYAYVDLGLSVKWATCNVGTTTPAGYGNYYAWGETTTKSSYYESNCKTYDLYNYELRSKGYIGSDDNLTMPHDAARANWGSTWRMPTKEEMEELVNNCNLEWTTQGGIKGCKVTGPNGNSIFFPAAGCRYGTSPAYTGDDGYYWSSTSIDILAAAYYSWDFFFLNGQEVVWYDERHFGRSVRPVSD